MTIRAAAGLLFLFVTAGCTMDWLNKPTEEKPADFEVTRDIDLDGDGLADRTETVMSVSGTLIRYSLHQNEDSDGDGKADRRRRTDFFNAEAVCQGIEGYSYNLEGKKVQVRKFDPTGAKTMTVGWKEDEEGNLLLSAQWDGSDDLYTFEVNYLDAAGRAHRSVRFMPPADSPVVNSHTVRTYSGNQKDSPLTSELFFNTDGNIVSGITMVYKEDSDQWATKFTYGEGGILVKQETVKYASDYLPENLPVEAPGLEDYELSVTEVFVRSLRSLAVIPDEAWDLLPLPAIPEEPATPEYTLESDTSVLTRDVTVIQAWDPYGSTKVVLDPLTFNLADNTLLVGAASQARETLSGLPEVIIPDADLPYRPRQIVRTDSRLAQPLTMDLTYDSWSRILKQTTSYGSIKALELEFAYGAPGEDEEYLLTGVSAGGEAMILPLDVNIGYDSRKLPVSLEVVSSETILSSFDFLYGTFTEEVEAAIQGFDPVKAAQDPLAFGSRLLSILETGWTIRHYGLGNKETRLPAAEYRFQPQTASPGIKVSIYAWDDGKSDFSAYRGYYLLTMDAAERAVKFQIWTGDEAGKETLKESTSYAYGSWGDKIYEYKDEFEGLAAGAGKELAGTDLLAFLGLGGSSTDEVAASLMTLLFR